MKSLSENNDLYQALQLGAYFLSSAKLKLGGCGVPAPAGRRPLEKVVTHTRKKKQTRRPQSSALSSFT
jgi:hypothetical protein